MAEASVVVLPKGKIPLEYGSEVCVIRKNWGQAGVPKGKIDYLDRITFIGGVARNVPRDLAEKWLDIKRIGIHVFPNDADESDFVKATGVKPMPIEEFAAMLKGYDLKEVVDAIGEEGAMKLMNDLRKLVKSGEGELKPRAEASNK